MKKVYCDICKKYIGIAFTKEEEETHKKEEIELQKYRSNLNRLEQYREQCIGIKIDHIMKAFEIEDICSNCQEKILEINLVKILDIKPKEVEN